MTEELLQATVGRVLHSSFKEPSESRLFLKETAAHLKQNPQISIKDLSSNAIMEVLLMVKNGNIMKKKAKIVM